jgi:hypothetical protein
LESEIAKQPAFFRGFGRGELPKPAFLQGFGVPNRQKPAFLRGFGGGSSQNLHFYRVLESPITENLHFARSAFQERPNAPQTCIFEGGTSKKPAFLHGLEVLGGQKPAFLQGLRRGKF